MQFKLILSAALSICLIFATFGQEIAPTDNRTEFDISEIITIQFEVKTKVDSATTLRANEFWILAGPSISSSYSIMNGKAENTYTLSYKIKAKEPGELVIPSPVFYFGDAEFKATDVRLTITGDSLTEAELKRGEFEAVRNNLNKQEGTIRYVMNGEFGFIERYSNSKWELVRELTKEEINNLMIR